MGAHSHSMTTFPGKHDYVIQVLRSQPRRSYSLFPYASNHKQVKVWQEEVLVVLSEQMVVRSTEQTIASSTIPGREAEAENAAETRTDAPRRAALPVVGLEANIYTIPATSSSMIYISKVDTTGLSSGPFSPARTLVSSFLAYFLVSPPHDMTRLRIHVFAKSQPQYLFPGSVENPNKKKLDDKGLARWWKSCISAAADAAMVPSPPINSADQSMTAPLKYAPKMFYLIPGMTHAESLPYIPNVSLSQQQPSPQSTSSATNEWQLPQTKPVWLYGHSYTHLPSLLHSPTRLISEVPITDLIPAFPDDPKSRFIQSTTSSTLSAAGLEGDFDDVFARLKSATITTGANGASQARGLDEIERERDKEAKRFLEVEGGVEGWWEMMAFRQECCSGALVAFFVVARGDEEMVEFEQAQTKDAGSSIVTSATLKGDKDGDSSAQALPSKGKASRLSVQGPPKERMAVHHPAFVRLWSSFHNVDYSLKSLSKAAAMACKWMEDVERVTKNEDDFAERSGLLTDLSDEAKDSASQRYSDEGYERHVKRSFEVRNEHAEQELRKKREADKVASGQPKVNMLAPRKKKPKTQ
ncbi:hypothetical protein OIO90_002507 [Microbotryomycetes sp. JL221]|nr:hypothetical protein OIO90_002507 [Microbotryomycetes sp. JL221]